MAVKSPQFDNSISGASDLWDNGLAGELITVDYFEEPASIIETIKDFIYVIYLRRRRR